MVNTKKNSLKITNNVSLIKIYSVEIKLLANVMKFHFHFTDIIDKI